LQRNQPAAQTTKASQTLEHIIPTTHPRQNKRPILCVFQQTARPISGFSWSGMTFFESSSRSISLFEHDLRANASRLSRGKTGAHPRIKSEGMLFRIMLQNIIPWLQLLLPLAVVRCCTQSQFAGYQGKRR